MSHEKLTVQWQHACPGKGEGTYLACQEVDRSTVVRLD